MKQKKRSTTTIPTTSTPGPSRDGIVIPPAPEVSEISMDTDSSTRIGSTTLTGLSGIEDISTGMTNGCSGKREKGKGLKKKMSESFIDPFDLTIDVSEEFESDYYDDDDFEPSFNFTIRPDILNFEDLPMDPISDDDDDDDDDSEDGSDIEEDDDTESTQERHFEDISRVKTDADINGLLGNKVCLTYLQQLLLLAKAKISSICHVTNCKRDIQAVTEFRGSAIYLKWVCDSGHLIYKWCSQPIMKRRLHSGDILTSAAILLSGNNHAKISLFAKILNMKIVSPSSFHKIQKHYLVPSIDEYWFQHQREILDKYRDRDIVVLGDGRMDSPGFNAQYCSYTIMENDSKDILSIVTMDKRMTERKSTNLEKACFVQSMTMLTDKDMKIGEVVTDSHLQIGAVMKRTYPDVKHSHDLWHVAKNLGNKIIQAGQDKDCRALQKWCRDIITHFWYSCKKASSYEEFLGVWCGVLHHVTDEHEWVLPYGQGSNQCDHGPLTERSEKEWLTKNGPAHVALRKIVLDKNFLKKIPYYLSFRSTAELETFQQNILMYAAKRFAYTPPVYRVRNILAALDHNVHHNRELKKNRNGEVVYHRHFHKKSGRWSATPVKIDKTYPHIADLKKRILEKRLSDHQGMQRKLELEPQDPRRLSAHLAAIPPPSTASIVQDQLSRRT
ncbi:uncharacterized protein [Ptychodera flava]|uniref:uncharacterized protein n=1 Tax=Ptychodera flava TaxID=63121 RepID=UPI00396A7B4F